MRSSRDGGEPIGEITESERSPVASTSQTNALNAHDRFLDAFRAMAYPALSWGQARFVRLICALPFLFQPFHLVRE